MEIAVKAKSGCQPLDPFVIMIRAKPANSLKTDGLATISMKDHHLMLADLFTVKRYTCSGWPASRRP